MSHLPVMSQEVVTQLVVNPEGSYLDATFGQGGHSKQILDKLAVSGRLLAIDRDVEVAPVAAEIQDSRFEFRCMPFAQIDQLGKEIYDGIFLDLGISSVQLDDPERGFGFLSSNLDMRMDRSRGLRADEWLHQVSADNLSKCLRYLADERYSKKLSKVIKDWVAGRGEISGKNLATCIAEKYRGGRSKIHPATRCFLAIRMMVNDEVEQLQQVLQKSVQCLKPEGRLLVLTFHSTEDRLVKNYFRFGSFVVPDQTNIRLQKVHPAELKSVQPPLKPLGKPKRPSDLEIRQNQRARSAQLRIAVRRQNAN